MQSPTAESAHIAAVDAWLARALTDDSPLAIVTLFRDAFETLWQRAATALGTVTLTAITERVLHTTAAKYRSLSVLDRRPHGDARWKQHLAERLRGVPREELFDGLRFTLINLLAVIGRLTAEILTDDLHATLREVGLPMIEAEPRPEDEADHASGGGGGVYQLRDSTHLKGLHNISNGVGDESGFPGGAR